MNPKLHSLAVAAFAGVVGLAGPAGAQTIDPFYADAYQAADLGSVAGVPANYGGLTFKFDDLNTLLIGGSANAAAARIFEVHVARDIDGHVISFGCTPATYFADGSGGGGGIDGGLQFGPGNVLFFTSYSDNHIGQVRPGETAVARAVFLGDLNIASSVGALQFVPPGFPGAGRLKIASYNASIWYDTTVSPAAANDGTYDIAPATPGIAIPIGGGPEGIVYIAAGNPHFANPSVLVTEYSTGRVVSYEVDGNGDPLVNTRRVFLSGLGGVEGAAIDPITGDFLFSTYGGGNRVIRVRGFTTTPSCQGDLNHDQNVGLSDLTLLLSSFGVDVGGDLNGDCQTNLSDLTILLSNFGNVCAG